MFDPPAHHKRLAQSATKLNFFFYTYNFFQCFLSESLSIQKYFKIAYLRLGYTKSVKRKRWVF